MRYLATNHPFMKHVFRYRSERSNKRAFEVSGNTGDRIADMTLFCQQKPNVFQHVLNHRGPHPIPRGVNKLTRPLFTELLHTCASFNSLGIQIVFGSSFNFIYED